MDEQSAVDSYLAWCKRRELRPSYIHAIRLTLERLTTAVGVPPEAATEEQVQEWWKMLCSDPDVKSGARAAYLSHVAGFYRWCCIWERLRADNPTERIQRPRRPRGYPRPIRAEHLKRAFSLAEGDIRMWLLLATFMGFRACEIAVASRENIVNGDLMEVTGKGGKLRIVPVHPFVAAELDAYPETGPMFPGMTPLSVSRIANRFLHQTAGIDETLHQCRHHFGTNLYRNTRDLRLTQETMGHSNPSTTAGYAAWSPDKAAAAVASLEMPA